jgi:hypothetical protein
VELIGGRKLHLLTKHVVSPINGSKVTSHTDQVVHVCGVVERNEVNVVKCMMDGNVGKM